MFSNEVLIGGLALIALQYIVALECGTLTRRGMRHLYPSGGVLPLLWHEGIWSDIPLTFLFAYLAKKYGGDWSLLALFIASAIGMVASVVIHVQVYAKGTVPEAHAHDDEVTLVGWIHALYFAGAVAILILTFAVSVSPSKSDLWMVAALMTTHVLISSHLIAGFFATKNYGEKPWQNRMTWLVVGGAAITLSASALIFGR